MVLTLMMASVVRSYHRGESQTMVHPSLEAHLYHFELGLPQGSVGTKIVYEQRKLNIN